ncbi:MAG: response regulator [Fibrobacter sp.]|nr:response regulator [Fibrobacter sp.]
MKLLQISVLLLVSVLCSLAQPPGKKMVSVIVLKDIKPVSYIDTKGNAAGLFSDLIVRIGERNGFKVKFVPSTWAEGMDLVKQGTVDLMPAVAWSEDREQFLDFGKVPVIVSWGTLAIHTDSILNDLQDINGKKIAIMKGDQNARNFKAFIKDFSFECEFIEVDKHDQIIPLIEHGEVYGGVLFNTFNIQSDQVEKTSIVFGAIKSFYATRKGTNAALLHSIDNQLKEWKHDKNSFYYHATNHNIMQHINAEAGLPQWLLVALLITATLAVLLILWVITLRIAVYKKTCDIKSSETRLRNIVENMPVMMTAFNDTLTITAWNNECERISGYNAYEMQHNPDALKMLMPEDLARRSFCDIINGDADFYSKQFTLTAKDGTLRIVSWSKVSTRFPIPQWHSWVIGVDITEQKKYEAEQITLINRLRQSEKMEAIGQLAGGIAHDFNNILGGIIGYADIAIDSMSRDDPTRTYIDKLIKSAERARNLVAQILSFSRQSKEMKTVVNVGRIISEVVDMLRATLPASIKINTIIESNQHTVLADPTKIHEIIMNLSTNAAHAMNDKGELQIICKTQQIDVPMEGRIGTIQKGIYTVVSVIDNGCGMDQQTLDHIFEPFYTTKETGKGTGMGLAVIFGIVQSHNGNITVESTEGKGSCFTIYIPSTNQHEPPVTADSAAIPSGKENILVIDYELVLIDLLTAILTSLGYTVTSFSDSKSALDMFRADPDKYDLVITDQTMPGISGLDLSKEMLKIRSALPVILCSGFSKQVDERIALDAGIKAFITKPFRKRELAIIIRDVLDNNAGNKRYN